jgi:dihydroflavonol-4-reductase
MKNNKLVFVTGADGMLGAHICRELLQKGYEVKALVQANRNLNVLNGLSIEIIYGDILDFDFLLKKTKGCNFLIHCAASTSIWPRKSEIVKNVNLTGTLNVAKAVLENEIQRFIHIGTASSFGMGTIENPGNESCLFNSDKFHLDYIDSKFEAQNILINNYFLNKLPVVIINPTFMIGPFDSGPSSGKMLIELYKNKLPAYSAGGKNFVFTKDVAVAAVNAIKFGRLGECYIAGNKNLSYKQFLEIACKVSNKEFKLKKTPSLLLIGFGFINSIWARLRKKPPVLSYTMAKIATENQYYKADKAVKELLMPQTPIETAIKESLEWFKQNGYL